MDCGFQSAIGAGTTILKRLPAILLVDDEDGIRQRLCNALISAGYNALQASDGPEALRLVADHQERIDVLVTDVIIPNLNGPELAQRLKAAKGQQSRFENRISYQAILRPRFFCAWTRIGDPAETV
jgi:CheY-like chemotaxis protein